jgi:hypothetical protein
LQEGYRKKQQNLKHKLKDARTSIIEDLIVDMSPNDNCYAEDDEEDSDDLPAQVEALPSEPWKKESNPQNPFLRQQPQPFFPSNVRSQAAQSTMSKKVNSKTMSGAAKDDENPFKVDPNFFDELEEKRKAFENGAKHQLFDTNEPVVAPTKATVAAAKKLVEGQPPTGPMHQNWMEDPELDGDSKDDDTPVKKKRKNRRKKNRRKKKDAETGQDDEANEENAGKKDKNLAGKAEGDSCGHNG